MTCYHASKKLGTLVICVLWAVTFSSNAAAQTMISTLSQLRGMTGNGNYLLSADIDASATQTPGQEFIPIGTWAAPFTGTFRTDRIEDKPKYKISNLKINSSGPATGLFSYTSGATIEYVTLENVSVTGLHQTGALVGVATNTSIEKVGVTGTVSGRSGGGPWLGVGMIVGTAYGSTGLYNCWGVGTVNGPLEQGGGLVGSAFGNFSGAVPNHVRLISTFSNVSVSSTVPSQFTGTIKLGGILGVGQGVEIQDASSVGSVTARDPAYVGGIAGDLTRPNMSTPGWVIYRAMTRSAVTVTGLGANRAGTIGHHDSAYEATCATLWDSTADSGTPRSDSTACQTSATASQLKAPTQVFGVFSRGGDISCPPLYPEQPCGPMHRNYPGGSDGRWEDDVWNYNSATQHITLKKIPDAVQPK